VVGSITGGSKNNVPPTGTHATTTTHRHRARHRTSVVAKPKTARLQLTPTGSVYVCLLNAAGTKLINQRTFAAGDTIPTETARKLLLTLGNASVQMKVNGKTVPVAPSSSAIRLMVTPSGTHPIPLSTPPTCP
jgi:cytoskeleton protein RodZ